MNFKKIVLTLIYLETLLATTPTHKTFAHEISGGRLVEDFSTSSAADFSASTGIWDSVNRQARAGAVADGDAARPISFGDGTLGSLSSSTGYHFDTDLYPGGFNFTSLNITGGAVTVSGSKALIIRSLGAVSITPALSALGGNGSIGATSGAGNAAGAAGGTAIASAASGGTGGSVNAGVGAGAGGSAVNSDGSIDAGTPGGAASSITAVAGSPPGSNSLNGPGDFDLTGGFVGGASGAGGGGHSAIPPDASQATGGSGGAGGGAIQITALGNISLGAVADASGGDGGSGIADASSCSGSGGGGNGGAVWLQALGAITAATPTVNAGNGGAGGGCVLAGPNGLAGLSRADASSVAGGIAQTYDTTNTAPNQTYFIYSKSYDLGVLNAVFSTPTITSSSPNGGTISVAYAGSENNSNFSSYTSSIAQLSNRSFRYLKFRITITTSGVAGLSPSVSSIAIPFTDSGLPRLDLKISPGCGTLSDLNSSHGKPDRGLPGEGILWCGIWLLIWAVSYGAVRTALRLDSKT